MKTFANKSVSDNMRTRNQSNIGTKPANSLSGAVTTPMFQHKSSCACGGGCPRCQEPSDAPALVQEALDAPGQPLDSETSAFMESRFGSDFGEVRVHTNEKAAASAHAMNAHAYTLGSNIVFGTNQYTPGTFTGQRLLAHELAHVIQQSHETEPVLRRMVRGSGTPPGNWSRPGGGTFTLTVVPAAEIERVDNAISQVREVATNSDRYSACHDFFQQRCPNATPNTLQQVFNNAQIWKLADPSGNELARGDTNGSNIAYTPSGYAQGTQGLAETLMHELGHNCGIPGDATHYHAEMAAAYCMGQGRNQLSLQFAFNDQTFMLFFTYRRILAELGAGHFRLTAGGDWNYVGTILEIANARSPSSRTIPYEFGSAMVGLQGRTPLGGRLGAERFGGLFGRIETGFGAGRFLIREPRPDETTDIYGSYVLQLTGGVEFLIPRNPHVFPLSIEAGYRLTQPLTSEAERIHTFSLSSTFHF
jgi:Domain of unknown function (DUF4157)